MNLFIFCILLSIFRNSKILPVLLLIEGLFCSNIPNINVNNLIKKCKIITQIKNNGIIKIKYGSPRGL